MVKYEFVANLPASLSAKEFCKRLTFGKVMGKSLVYSFLTHGVGRHCRYVDLYVCHSMVNSPEPLATPPPKKTKILAKA